MRLKEKLKKDIDELGADELVLLSEQIRLIKRVSPSQRRALPLEEIHKLTSSSNSVWSEDIILERQERN